MSTDPAAEHETAASSYRRSAGSTRGLARRQELLERITDDIAANGLAGLTLRRAAAAAGTTHKVLLYHFADLDELMTECVRELRQRRVRRGLASALQAPGSLADKLPAIWKAVSADEARVLDEAMGLAMLDPVRHGHLAVDATEQYIPTLVDLCPPDWPRRRKLEIAHLVLATMRGMLVNRLTHDGAAGTTAALAALQRAVRREEQLP
jgi:AcrR family transcriptional regulator